MTQAILCASFVRLRGEFFKHKEHQGISQRITKKNKDKTQLLKQDHYEKTWT